MWPWGWIARAVGRVEGWRRRLDHEYDIAEYWDWIAVALFLLVTVDMLTTIFASVSYGLIAEVNPVVRWGLSRGIEVLALLNLAAVVLVVALFYLLMEMIRRTPKPYDSYFAIGVELWLGFLIAAGLVVFANNLSAIVLGRSLI